MQSKEIKQVLAENDKYNLILARYDETREFDLDRTRKSFTLKKSSYRKLKNHSKQKGMPMSRILDSLIEGLI
jgi:hypothetical protein